MKPECPKLVFRFGRADEYNATSSTLRPTKPLEDSPAHDPVLVVLGEKIQRLGEMGHALAVTRLGVGVRDIGSPIAAARAIGFEQAANIGVHVPERIRLG